MIALSETLALEVAEDNIKTIDSCPTIFKSALLDSSRPAIGGLTGTTGAGLQDAMEITRYSSDHIALSIIRNMVQGKLYNVPMHDARTRWRALRYFPELTRKGLRLLYERRLWLFAEERAELHAEGA